MYVVSTQRSGATAFCINHAFQNNMEYGGDLHALHCNAFLPEFQNDFIEQKKTFHETGIQPSFDPLKTCQAWADIMNPQKIYMVPAFNVGVYNNASFFITRKNVRNLIKSIVNYRIKASRPRPIIPTGVFNTLVHDLTVMAIMLTYCKENNKTITWYEDVFTRDTEYTFYNDWYGRGEFEFLIDNYLAKSILHDIHPDLIV